MREIKHWNVSASRRSPYAKPCGWNN